MDANVSRKYEHIDTLYIHSRCSLIFVETPPLFFLPFILLKPFFKCNRNKGISFVCRRLQNIKGLQTLNIYKQNPEKKSVAVFFTQTREFNGLKWLCLHPVPFSVNKNQLWALPCNTHFNLLNLNSALILGTSIYCRIGTTSYLHSFKLLKVNILDSFDVNIICLVLIFFHRK